MPPPSRREIDLGRRLAHRLMPLASVIAVLISAVPPIVYYALELASLKQTAGTYAQNLSERLQDIVLEAPGLWKYSAQKYSQLLSDFLPSRQVANIRVTDEGGQPVVAYEYATDAAQWWWNRYTPAGSAPIVFNNRVLGRVQVCVPQGALLGATGLLFLICTGAGMSLALLVYRFPVSVVTKMEARIRDLIDTVWRSNSELTARNAELDSFVYSVSHDLKAPLVALQGMTGLLLEDCGPQLDSTGRHYVERIQANAQHMERLILDLLALSRIGREAQPPEPVHLAEVVDGLLATLAAPIRARAIKIIRGELATVWAIRTQMEQVLGTLLSNAVKYLGDAPSPAIEIATTDRGAFLECAVSDNGIGIDPAYHDKIFELFQRLGDLETEGTGVGLAIAKKIVETGGGQLWVESTKGQGATFRFTWPKTPGRAGLTA